MLHRLTTPLLFPLLSDPFLFSLHGNTHTRSWTSPSRSSSPPSSRSTAERWPRSRPRGSPSTRRTLGRSCRVRRARGMGYHVWCVCDVFLGNHHGSMYVCRARVFFVGVAKWPLDNNNAVRNPNPKISCKYARVRRPGLAFLVSSFIYLLFSQMRLCFRVCVYAMYYRVRVRHLQRRGGLEEGGEANQPEGKDPVSLRPTPPSGGCYYDGGVAGKSVSQPRHGLRAAKCFASCFRLAHQIEVAKQHYTLDVRARPW